MELEANRHGGSFEVTATPEERITILDAISANGLVGIGRDEERFNPNLDSKVFAGVRQGTDWDRGTAEIVAATLETSGGDIKTQAARAILAMQIRAALDSNPRR